MNKGKRAVRIRGLYDLSGKRIELAAAREEGGWRIEYLGDERPKRSTEAETSTDTQLIRASGGILSPAFVDLLGHPDRLRTTPHLQKTMAAAGGGGYGTILDAYSPAPSAPGYESYRKRAASYAASSDTLRPALLSSLPLPSTEQEAERAKESGVRIFTDRMIPEPDTKKLHLQLTLAAQVGLPVMLSPLCPGWEGVLAGQAAGYFHLPGVPDAAEALAVSRGLILAKSTGCAVHFPCLTCAESLSLIRQAKAEGLAVTCSVTPFHLALDAQDVFFAGTGAKLRPPLSSAANREAIVEGICDGTVDCICSGHTPLTDSDKAVPMDQANFGAPMYPTAFGICHTVLVRSGLISLSRLAQLMSLAPGRILGMEPTLRVGAICRFCILSPGTEWVVGERFAEEVRHSPLLGRTLRGTVSHAFGF